MTPPPPPQILSRHPPPLLLLALPLRRRWVWFRWRVAPCPRWQPGRRRCSLLLGRWVWLLVPLFSVVVLCWHGVGAALGVVAAGLVGRGWVVRVLPGRCGRCRRARPGLVGRRRVRPGSRLRSVGAGRGPWRRGWSRVAVVRLRAPGAVLALALRVGIRGVVVVFLVRVVRRLARGGLGAGRGVLVGLVVAGVPVAAARRSVGRMVAFLRVAAVAPRGRALVALPVAVAALRGRVLVVVCLVAPEVRRGGAEAVPAGAVAVSARTG